MGLMAKKGEGGDFEMVPEDTYVARCYRVIDLGTVHDEKWGKDVHKIQISWEFPSALMTQGENAGRPFSIHNRYTLSLHEKASLRKDLESWRGKTFTDDELSGFNVSKLLGATCLINVTHNHKDDKTYANISSIMKLPQGMECPDAINDALMFDIDEFDQTIFESLSERLQETIQKSYEFKLISNPIDKDNAPPIANDESQEPGPNSQSMQNDW